MALYKSLNIALRPSNYTFSFSSALAPSPWLIYNGQNGLRGLSLPSSIRPSLPPLRTIVRAPHIAVQSIASQFQDVRTYLGLVVTLALSYLQLLVLAFWHHLLGHCSDPSHPITKQPFGEWCLQRRLSLDFVNGVVLSLFSAVMTCQHDAVLACPTSEILSYVAMTFFRSHYQVAEGVQQVEAALTKGLDADRIHTSTTVKGLHPTNARAKVCLVLETADQETQLMHGFDHVILTTPAHLSASLVESYIDALRARRRVVPAGDDEKKTLVQEEARLETVLGKLLSIRVEDSLVINHTDRSLLPLNRRDWRDLNLASPSYWSSSPPSEDGTDSCEDATLVDSLPILSSIHNNKEQQQQQDDGVLVKDGRMSPYGGLARHTMATHVVSRLRSKGQLLLQTTNPLPGSTPRPQEVLSASRFQRVMTPPKALLSGLFDWRPSRRRRRWSGDRGALGERLLSIAYACMPVSKWEMVAGDLQGGQEGMPGVWFCGSYSYGIPLLEGCVVGSDLVVESILRRTP